MAPQEQPRLVAMRLRVPSLASLRGLRIRRCWELRCRWQTRLGSRVAVAGAQAGRHSADSTPSLGPSMCRRSGPRKGKETKEKKLGFYFNELEKEKQIKSKSS